MLIASICLFVCLSVCSPPAQTARPIVLKFSEINVTDPVTVPHWRFVKFDRPKRSTSAKRPIWAKFSEILKFHLIEFTNLICKSCSNFKSIGWNLRILENLAQIGLLADVDLFGRLNFTNPQCVTVEGSVTLISENFRTIGWAIGAGGELTDKQTNKPVGGHG